MVVVIEGDVQRVLELLGVFAFATSGALVAVRKGFDIVGILALAWITALGGGIIRDLLVDATPPTAFLDAWAFTLPVVAASITFFGHRVIERSMKAVLIFDAVGLGLFTVVGTVTGAASGLGIAQASAVGVITGVGGGLLRDIVAREVPVLVRPDTELYAVPALTGSIALAFAISRWGYRPLLGVSIASVIIVFRLAALAFGWRAPRAWGQTNSG
jgi:uncharacterized membrane protein YeiH